MPYIIRTRPSTPDYRNNFGLVLNPEDWTPEALAKRPYKIVFTKRDPFPFGGIKEKREEPKRIKPRHVK